MGERDTGEMAGFSPEDREMGARRPPEISDGRVVPHHSFREFGRDQTEQSLVSRFEQKVREYPDRLAVRSRNSRLSYTDLNRMANRVSREILKRGEEGDGPIALLMELDAPLLAAILGVLKTGRAYVPLDPSFGNARNADILEDSGSRLLITDSKNAQLAGALKNDASDVLDVDRGGLSGSDGNPGLTVSPDATAYILYTSGSTGRPKGVFQNHRNVLHNVRNYTNGLHISADDRLTLLYSCSFGASVSDIFGALLNGAGLFPFDLKKEGLARLVDWLIGEEITIYHSVPTVYRHFVATLTGKEEFPGLRLIKLGGESVQTRDFELYKKHFHRGCVFHVGLGSTELGIIRQFFGNHATVVSGSLMPVGYPVEGVEVLLLDEKGEDTGPGAVGEIAIRSGHLALGYWKNPDLTVAAFLPGSPDGAVRMYRTGDIGRMLADGCLIHLGRKDFQLKIRGYRVEAAEVEMALLEIPSVKGAVVVGQQDRYGDQRLVAYITSDRQPLPSSARIREMLKGRLPEYMVPASFVMMDALPLTPNGKIDRMALPPPADIPQDPERRRTVPQNKVQQRLLRIWEKVLGVSDVGITDNFFDLGGHSLLAVRTVDLIRKKTGKDIPEDVLLKAPTIEQLAELVNSYDSSAAWSTLVPIQTSGSRPPFFWIYGGAKAFLPRYLGPEQPVYGLVHQSQDGRKALYTSVEEIASSYLREIKTVQPGGPYRLGGYCFGGMVALEMAQQLKSGGEQVSLLFLVEPPARCLPAVKRTKVLRGHFRNLSLLEPREKFAYLTQRIEGVMREGTKRTGKRLRMAVCEYYFRRGRPLPHSLRKFYIREVHRQASKAYVSRSYPGNVTVFRAGKYAHGRGRDWQRLADSVEIRKIPGADHVSIVRRPYIGVWAEALNTRLEDIGMNSGPGEQ